MESGSWLVVSLHPARTGDIAVEHGKGLRSRETVKYGLAGLRTKNDCAGEDQQLFTRPETATKQRVVEK
jgi:hypothetical protein